MSGQQYLNTFTENATRLGMRLQESFSEHTRDLAIGRGVSAAYMDSLDDRGKNIRKQLDSNSDREKLDAMKRLIALISKGRNVSEYFAQVVKNVASQNLEIRKLVYIYLLRYAEQEPDLALLSINTFQKDLTDSNPLIRAMALRVLSGIRVPMIGNIVVLAIKKCAADVSPYVRKTAGLAISRCYELDSGHLSSLIQIITSMLKERSPLAIGSVAVAFDAVCPTRLDLLHPQYRRLCRMLADVDEWGQVDLMNLLLRYARTMLPRPTKDELDPDVKLLLTSVEPVLLSCNPASVMAAVRVIYYAGPPGYLERVVQPLLKLLHKSREVERVVLVYLLIIVQKASELFAPHHSRFLLRTDDALEVKRVKIQLLLKILNSENYGTLLREFIDYSDDTDDGIVSDSVLAIGHCASAIPEATQQCLAALITMIQSGNDSVTGPAVMVLKTLVQTQLASMTSIMGDSPYQAPLSIIARLARKIDDIKNAPARACVIWLVGQYAASEEPCPGPEGIAKWAPDVLRKTAKTFGQEVELVKLQIITLAAKLFVLSPEDRTLNLLSQYVFSLARYDNSYDVRDRAKMLRSLLSGISPNISAGLQDERVGVVLRREQVRLVLFEGKSGVVEDKSSRVEEDALLGCLSPVLGKPMQMDSLLPDWLEKGVESTLRESEDDRLVVPVPTAISSSSIGQRKTMTSPVILTPATTSRPGSRQENIKGTFAQDLDSFYADATSEGESEEGEDSEDDEDENDDSDVKAEDAEDRSEARKNVEDDDSTTEGGYRPRS
ncbi:AP-3 complex subunit beta-2 [Leucoagaricus sp. SymC.cos]|nr:AP-3 complex subunit beta-2 [Leucoagaricus sp. SymC.cos]